MSMYNKRKMLISTIVTSILIIGGMLLFQVLSKQKGSTISKGGPTTSLRKVETAPVIKATIDNQIALDGRLTAYEKVDLASKVGGVLERTGKPFKVGVTFSKGDLLFEIDDREARYNLLSQRANLLNAITQIMPDLKFDLPNAYSKWLQYINEFKVDQNIAPLPMMDSDKEKYYVASKNIISLYYNIKSLESRLADYKIYAPFSGIIAEASTFPGALVGAGARLGTLINTSKYELEAPISSEELRSVKAGQRVTISNSTGDKTWEGIVARIGSTIDPATQYVPVYITVSGKDLKEGMYVKGILRGAPISGVTVIPKPYLADQNAVFIVEDSIVKKARFNLIKVDRENVYTNDLKEGALMITDVVTGLYDGQKIIPLQKTK